MVFTQLLINGLIGGSIYALIACGFGFIYTTNRFIHFAHGATVTVAAYIFYWMISILAWPFAIVVILTILAASLFGFLMHLLIYMPLKRRNSSSTILLIASIGIMIFFNNLIQLIFGAEVKIIYVFENAKGVNLFGAHITILQITMILTVFAILVGLFLFRRYSKLGKLMQAVADNPELAKTSGINSTNVQHWSFIIGSAMAGVAAILIGLESNIEPIMGITLMVHGFTAAVIGGVTSIIGPIFGGLMIGLIENFGVWFLPASYKAGIVFGLLLFFLLVRPQGIFGINKGTRE